jgi:hypothetical protein
MTRILVISSISLRWPFHLESRRHRRHATLPIKSHDFDWPRDHFGLTAMTRILVILAIAYCRRTTVVVAAYPIKHPHVAACQMAGL